MAARSSTPSSGGGGVKGSPGAGPDAEAGWIPITNRVVKGTLLRRDLTADHPLLDHRKPPSSGPAIVPVSAGAGPTEDVAAASAGPVALSMDAELDPLSAMLMAESAAPSSSVPVAHGAGGASSAKLGAHSLHSDEAWAEARAIMGKWTTKREAIRKVFDGTESVNVTANFLSDVDGSPTETTRPVALETSRKRLEQLERSSETGEATVEISLKEYLNHVRRLEHDLQGAWMRAERVKSLKIAIQSAKLLSHVAVPRFYPSMFCYITGILDSFGQLVFERIRVRAEEVNARMGGPKTLPEDFTCHDIGDDAKETCKNWIYKTACIRELVPRVYVEIALLKLYRYMTEEEDLHDIVARLSRSIRGIGNPLVAIYARTYLSLMASQVIHGNENRQACLFGVQDFMFSFKDMESEGHTAWLDMMGLTSEDYLRLMSPAVSWLLAMTGNGASKEVFQAVMVSYKDLCGNSMVLNHIFESFDPAYYAPHTASLVELVKESTPSNISLAELYTTLAQGLTKTLPPEAQRMPFLREAWKVISKEPDLLSYTKCCSIFIELLLVGYTEREVLILLEDLVRHMKQAIRSGAAAAGGGGGGADGSGGVSTQAPEGTLPYLEKILTRLVQAGTGDLGSVVTSDQFIMLLDLCHGDRKVAFCKTLLKEFVDSPGATNDPVVIHTLFDVAKTLHDSLDSLSVEDERRQVSALICKFLGKIDFGRDVEQHLGVLVDCRAAFSNLDSVKDRLVMAVLGLAMKALKLVRGRHNKKTSAFVKGCLAYCHITIPSIDAIFSRLALFKLAGEVALRNSCIPQADNFYKAIITEIPDMPEVEELLTGGRKPTEDRLVTFLLGFLSSLIVVPGHPQHGPFYLVKGLLSALERYPWSECSPGRTRVLIGLLSVLVGYAQPVLPLQVPNVESNDVLYAGDPAYVEELREYMNETMSKIMDQLAALGGSSIEHATKHQTRLVLDLLSVIVSSMDLNDETCLLTVKFIQLVRKNDPTNPQLAKLARLIAARARSGKWPSLRRLMLALR